MRYPTTSELMEFQGIVKRDVVAWLGADNPDVEDLTQEVLISFVKAIKQFHRDASLKTLLYVVTKRRFYDYLRRKYRDRRRDAELALFKLDTLLEGNRIPSLAVKNKIQVLRKTCMSIIEEEKKNGKQKHSFSESPPLYPSDLS